MDAASAPILAGFFGLIGLPALAALLLLRARASRLAAFGGAAALLYAALLALTAYRALGRAPAHHLEAPLRWLQVGTTTDLRLDLLLTPHSGALLLFLLLTVLLLLPHHLRRPAPLPSPDRADAQLPAPHHLRHPLPSPDRADAQLPAPHHLRHPLPSPGRADAQRPAPHHLRRPDPLPDHAPLTPTSASALLIGLSLALLSLFSASLVLSLAAWSLLGLLAAPSAAPSRLRRALGELGLWLLFGAALVGAGGLSLDLINRSALLAGGRAFSGSQLFGLDLATLAALGLVLALLGRDHPSQAPTPRCSPAPAHDPATCGASDPSAPLAAFSLLLVLDLALRLHPLFALARPQFWPLVALLSLLLLLARLPLTAALPRRLFARLPRDAPAPARHLGAPFVVLALALGAWGSALALALIHAFALPALTRRRLKPLLLLALLPAHTVLLALAWASPDAGPLLAPLLLLAQLALAAALTPALPRGALDHKVDGAHPSGFAALLALTAGLLALPDLTFLADVVPPELWDLLRAPAGLARALAPAQIAPFSAAYAALCALAAALLGLLLARRAIPAPLPPLPAPLSAPRLRALTLLPRLSATALEPALAAAHRRLSDRLWLAGGLPAARPGTALGLLYGVLLVLASVYCNPAATTLGPSAVHPIDLGGLDPQLRAPKRARPPAPAPLDDTDRAAAAAAAAAAADPPPFVIE